MSQAEAVAEVDAGRAQEHGGMVCFTTDPGIPEGVAQLVRTSLNNYLARKGLNTLHPNVLYVEHVAPPFDNMGLMYPHGWYAITRTHPGSAG